MPHGLKQRQPPGSAPLLGTCETQPERSEVEWNDVANAVLFCKAGNTVTRFKWSNAPIFKLSNNARKAENVYIQYSVEGLPRAFSKDDSWRRTSTTNNHKINIMPSTPSNTQCSVLFLYYVSGNLLQLEYLACWPNTPWDPSQQNGQKGWSARTWIWNIFHSSLEWLFHCLLCHIQLRPWFFVFVLLFAKGGV